MTVEKPFFFDREQLLSVADRHRERYQRAEPFPHVVIDDFLPAEVLDRVLEEFPSKDDPVWARYKNPAEKKLGNNTEALMGPLARHLLAQFNSAPLCEFLERLTGIEGIISDPYFWGGGQHQIVRGGFLKMHSDFNWHAKLKLDRRINLLLYLNKDWPEAFGGYLELWDKEMKACVQKIAPLFNRIVVFNTTSTSYHGHPEPLTCPEDRSRKSLALYYYTAGRPADEKKESHTTLFQERPGEDLSSYGREPLTAKTVLKKLLPPIVFDVIRLIRK